MSELPLSRRAVTRAFLAAPVALATIPKATATAVSSDPIWLELVADYRAKYAAWTAAVSLENEAEEAFFDACGSLPPEPTTPDLGLPNDILDMTLREIKASGKTPEHGGAWAQYEMDRTAWQARRDALHEQLIGSASTTGKEASSKCYTAFDTLTAYRVTNLHDLREKIEIIAQDYREMDIPPSYVCEILDDVRNLIGEA